MFTVFSLLDAQIYIILSMPRNALRIKITCCVYCGHKMNLFSFAFGHNNAFYEPFRGVYASANTVNKNIGRE